MKNLQLIPILLPTENASILSLMGDYLKLSEKNIKRIRSINQHPYLVSDSPTKEGDWFKYGHQICKCIKADEKGLHSEEGIAHRVNAFKIEFTADLKLIADGVLAIDGNTKAKIKCPVCNGMGHVGGSTCYNCKENCKIEVNFLQEYCKRYNQKDNQKGVDVEEYVKEQMDGVTKSRTYLPSEIEHLIRETYKDGIKANVGGFSLEDMKAKDLLEKASYRLSQAIDIFNGSSGLNTNKGEDKYIRMVGVKDEIENFIQSLTKEQPKRDIVIECEVEKEFIWKGGLKGENPEYKIKFNKDGQPTLIFK